MKSGRKLEATFSDGTSDHLTTEKAFTHAWRITGLLRTGKPAKISGWARSEPLAQQAAAHHARAVSKYWADLKVEVVEIEQAGQLA